MKHNKSIYGIYLLYCYFSMLLAADDDFSKIENEAISEAESIAEAEKRAEDEIEQSSHYLKLNKDGVKVYIYKHKNSDFATFRATTHINASLESILAVMLDTKSNTKWVDACEQSLLIKRLNFYEQYHYQIFYIPFPFTNRDFILHSTMEHNPLNKTITITMSSDPDYCRNKQSNQCQQINKSELVRVIKSVGTFKLEADEYGTKITWIQHTDPAGHLPGWLVNQLIKNTAYRSFKNLAEIVKEEQYKYARLTYDEHGVAIAVEIKKPAETQDKTSAITRDLRFYQTL